MIFQKSSFKKNCFKKAVSLGWDAAKTYDDSYYPVYVFTVRLEGAEDPFDAPLRIEIPAGGDLKENLLFALKPEKDLGVQNFHLASWIKETAYLLPFSEMTCAGYAGKLPEKIKIAEEKMKAFLDAIQPIENVPQSDDEIFSEYRAAAKNAGWEVIKEKNFTVFKKKMGGMQNPSGPGFQVDYEVFVGSDVPLEIYIPDCAESRSGYLRDRLTPQNNLTAREWAAKSGHPKEEAEEEIAALRRALVI